MMYKRWLSICCALLLIAGMALTAVVPAEASSERPMIDGSYLTYDDESEGSSIGKTKGEYLFVGYSKCVDMGPGEIYAGGSTLAVEAVSEVGVLVNVERAQEGDDHWEFVQSWLKTNEGVDRVSSNKHLEVEGGYYYRVYCTHWANGEVSSSFTDGVYIE